MGIGGDRYRIKAPAKLNIRLKVTGLRPDGYHELVSLMVPVDLFDYLEISRAPRGKVRIESSGFHVPADKTNLVYRAADSFLTYTGMAHGISIKLVKNIPVAAGLGGGSSDAAATLIALNEMENRPLSCSELHEMAIGLGADVPFFLQCRPSLARGIGEILESLETWPECYYLIVTPPVQVSTPWVYRNLKLELTTNEYASILDSLKSESFSIPHILENDLEKVTSVYFPIIDTLKRQLMEAGAVGALMSGSGPSVFGVFLSWGQAQLAKQALLKLRSGNVFLARNWERRK